MEINTKRIESELQSLNYDKRETEQWLEEARTKTIELISKGDSQMLSNLEDYTAYNELRRYSKRLEEIKAKLRVINYLIED